MCSCIIIRKNLAWLKRQCSKNKGNQARGEKYGKNMINIYSCILNIGKCVALEHAKYGLERYYVYPVFAPPELSNGCSIKI